MTTKHSFDAWQDANGLPDNGRPDVAVNTLLDILALTEENLPATTVAARVHLIARAALSRLDADRNRDAEDVGGPSGLQFEDGATAYIGEEVEVEPPPF